MTTMGRRLRDCGCPEYLSDLVTYAGTGTPCRFLIMNQCPIGKRGVSSEGQSGVFNEFYAPGQFLTAVMVEDSENPGEWFPSGEWVQFFGQNGDEGDLTTLGAVSYKALGTEAFVNGRSPNRVLDEGDFDNSASTLPESCGFRFCSAYEESQIGIRLVIDGTDATLTIYGKPAGSPTKYTGVVYESSAASTTQPFTVERITVDDDWAGSAPLRLCVAPLNRDASVSGTCIEPPPPDPPQPRVCGPCETGTIIATPTADSLRAANLTGGYPEAIWDREFVTISANPIANFGGAVPMPSGVQCYWLGSVVGNPPITWQGTLWFAKSILAGPDFNTAGSPSSQVIVGFRVNYSTLHDGVVYNATFAYSGTTVSSSFVPEDEFEPIAYLISCDPFLVEFRNCLGPQNSFFIGTL